MLNPKLVEKQNLTVEDVAALNFLHKELDDVVHNPHNYTDPVALIEDIEFQMQRLWRFDENRNMHTHWLRIKGCTCNRLDSLDALGTGLRYINLNCPWHGGKGR